MTEITISQTFDVDDCIADEVLELNQMGIQTLYCCCGHGSRHNAFISVKTDYQSKMREMGYKEKKPIIRKKVYRQYPKSLVYDHEYTDVSFLPKSKCNGSCRRNGGN